MVIFHSYVSLPEGKWVDISKQNIPNEGQVYDSFKTNVLTNY